MINILLITAFIAWGIAAAGVFIFGCIGIVAAFMDEDIPSLMSIWGFLAIIIGVFALVGCIYVGQQVWPDSPSVIEGACYKAYATQQDIPMVVGKVVTVVPYEGMELMQVTCP